MIVDKEYAELLDNMPAIAELEYSIDTEGASAHIMGMLRNMYADPHYAVVREYLTNAMDSHSVAGTEEPVEISVPNSFCQELRIRDYGVGLDAKEAEALFVYGRSGHGKRETNDQLGHFGIGSKSVFSVSSLFSIYTYKDGYERVWSAYLDRTGRGRSKLLSESFTGARDGVMIAIPAKKEEFDKFAHAVDSATRLLDVPVKVDGELRRPLDTLRKQYLAVLEGRDPDGSRRIYCIRDGQNYSTPRNVCVGGFAYSVPSSAYQYATDPAHVDLYVDVPVGAVSVTPSRDSLMFDDATKALCSEVLKRAQDGYLDTLQRYIDAADTPADAVERCVRIRRALPYAVLNSNVLLWRGTRVDLLSEVCISGVQNYYNGSRVGDLVGDYAVAFRLDNGRRGALLRPFSLPNSTFLSARYSAARGSFFVDDKLAVYGDPSIFMLETQEDTTYRRVLSAARNLYAQHNGESVVFIAGPAEQLAELRLRGKPVREVAAATATVPSLRPGNTRASVKVQEFIGAKLNPCTLRQCLPSEFWQPCDSRKLDWTNTIWVPSFACRIDNTHIPNAVYNKIYYKRPVVGNIALAKIQSALHHVDASMRIVTGGDKAPDGALTLRNAVWRIIEKYDDGKRPGALHPAFITLRHANSSTTLAPSWLFKMLVSGSERGRTYILERAKRSGTLYRLTKLIAGLAGDGRSHRDLSDDEHLNLFFRTYAVKASATAGGYRSAERHLAACTSEERARLCEGSGEIGKTLSEVSRLWHQLQDEVPSLVYLDTPASPSTTALLTAADALCALERVKKKEKN